MKNQNLFKQACLSLALLGPLFFINYGLANYVTFLRAPVPSVYFEWEMSIPVIPWMIIPYWSIDLFFALSLFCCQSTHALTTLTRRLGFAILVAVFCFLIYPLQFAFPRPEVNSLLGDLFNLLYAFDQPYNQAPSLHIALLVILWLHYLPLCNRLFKFIIHVWFSLIAVSVLFTYQHHFIDIPTGLALGWLSCYLFPTINNANHRSHLNNRNSLSFWQWQGLINSRYSLIYGLSALSCAGLVFINPPTTLILLWPTCSLIIISLGYAGLGADIFQKDQGRIQPAARWLLFPYHLGALLSWLWYTKNQPAYQRVDAQLAIGRKLNTRDLSALEALKPLAIVDLASEYNEHPQLINQQVPYLSLAIMDLTPPTKDQLVQAIQFIHHYQQQGYHILVHCALGYSRSAAVIIAYWLSTGRYNTLDEAIDHLHTLRPNTVLNQHFINTLNTFNKSNNSNLLVDTSMKTISNTC
ncbi:phosphatase PAP2 family protein [Zooshikella harenae]|uniref:Dual specificity protein phosphatase family protein n=1 Tax=Zooshikella harenae TaxID=2827238 RepID=A0ABS5ZAL4_9GAMM|nr:phosphatase PAP2 family protein [Zooshikella harenae]MBU2711098.1 dual specificity protein phosphatase family protein [Zooshikella harenae]